MNIDDLLLDGRKIWGKQALTLEEIIIHLNVINGDISRIARDGIENSQMDEDELKKELGNILFSVICWCDDLGLKPEECIALAKKAQLAYVVEHKGDNRHGLNRGKA